MQIKLGMEQAIDDSDILMPEIFQQELKGISQSNWKNLFLGFRRCLRSRISGCSNTEQLDKLKGKLELIQEMENFFLDKK